MEAFVRLADVTVESLEIELQLTEMFGLELTTLQLDADQTGQAAVEEQQVEDDILAADLQHNLAANETEVAAQLSKKTLQIAQEALVQVGLVMPLGQLQKLDQIDVAKDRRGMGMRTFSLQLRALADSALPSRTARPRAGARVTPGPPIAFRQAELEFAFVPTFAAAQG